jgi:type VI protein secretion system component VasK
VNTADKLLRWVVGILVVVFVIVAVWFCVCLRKANDKAEQADRHATQLYEYLKEEAPALRARHHELCARIDTLAVHIKFHTWGCDVAEVPKDPPPQH